MFSMLATKSKCSALLGQLVLKVVDVVAMAVAGGISQLEQRCIHDRNVWRLQAMVAERIRRE